MYFVLEILLHTEESIRSLLPCFIRQDAVQLLINDLYPASPKITLIVFHAHFLVYLV
jgi:hypothetical protein